MKTKFSKIIYHDHACRPGVTHFSVAIDFKTLILVGIVPGSVNYTHGRRMYHAHFFVSVFTFEVTAIL